MALSVLPYREDDDEERMVREDPKAAAMAINLDEEIRATERRLRHLKEAKREEEKYPLRPRLMDDDLIQIQELQTLAATQHLRSLGDDMHRIHDDFRRNNELAYAGLPLGLGKPVAGFKTAMDTMFTVAPALHKANVALMATFPQTVEMTATERNERVSRYLALKVATAEQEAALLAAKAQAEVDRVEAQVLFDTTQATLNADHGRTVDLKKLDQGHELTMAEQRTSDRMVMMETLRASATGLGIEGLGSDLKAMAEMVAGMGLSKAQEEGARSTINAELQRQGERRARTQEEMTRMALSGDLPRPSRPRDDHGGRRDDAARTRDHDRDRDGDYDHRDTEHRDRDQRRDDRGRDAEGGRDGDRRR